MPLAPSLVTAGKLPRLRAPKGGLVVAGRPYRAGVFLPESARPTLEAHAQAAATPTAPPVVVGILGFSYRIERLAIDPSIGDVAFALHDTDRNRHHHLHRTTAGEVVCDCGDFEFRRRGTGLPCKHGRALLQRGLIPAAVRLAPTSAVDQVSAEDADSATWPAWTDEPIPFWPTRPSAPATTTRRRRFEPTAEEFRQAAALLNA